MSLTDLNNNLGLNRRIAPQGRHSYGRACVPPAIAPQVNQQIGLAVGDFGQFCEAWSDVDVGQDLDDPLNLIEIAELRLDNGEMI